jgi:hypothetical protein
MWLSLSSKIYIIKKDIKNLAKLTEFSQGTPLLLDFCYGLLKYYIMYIYYDVWFKFYLHKNNNQK